MSCPWLSLHLIGSFEHGPCYLLDSCWEISKWNPKVSLCQRAVMTFPRAYLGTEVGNRSPGKDMWSIYLLKYCFFLVNHGCAHVGALPRLVAFPLSTVWKWVKKNLKTAFWLTDFSSWISWSICLLWAILNDKDYQIWSAFEKSVMCFKCYKWLCKAGLFHRVDRLSFNPHPELFPSPPSFYKLGL